MCSSGCVLNFGHSKTLGLINNLYFFYFIININFYMYIIMKTFDEFAKKEWFELSIQIKKFIEKYARISPNWNSEGGDGDKYTSPDVYQMLDCAEKLEKGIKPTHCWSEWSSGGYKPYSSKEGREEHDQLIKKIYRIINS